MTVAPAATAPTKPAEPGPENTPIPGPGTWRWSHAAAGWVPNTPQTAGDELADPPIDRAPE